MEEVKELGLVVGNEEESFWNDVIRNTELEIKGIKKALKFNEFILDNARIKLESLK